jgi:hypothetical protein
MLIYRHAFDENLQPYLQTDDQNISLKPGQILNIPLSKETYCLGYAQGGQRLTCPKKSTGKKQCSHCAKEDDFLVCLRCDGATCLQFTPFLKKDCFQGEYSVYLAAFGENVKAGISKTTRLEKRWVEQGADYAAQVFAGVNGQVARQIESALCRSGYLPRVTLDEKLACKPAEEGVLQYEFTQPHFQKIVNQYAIHALIDPKVSSLQSHYPMGQSARTTDSLNGTVLGTKGPVLFLQQNSQTRIFGLPKAAGHKIVQNTLSNYF